MRRYSHRLLVLAFVTGLLMACAPCCTAAVEGFDLLRNLGSTPASTVIAQYPEEARNLALDLLFYRWTCTRYGLDPEIDSLDRTISSLVSASKDTSVIWAASEFGAKDVSTVSVVIDPDNDRIKSMNDAKQSLESAVGWSNTYPTRSIENLTSCAAILNSQDMRLSWALVEERLAERQLYAVRRYREARANYERAYPIFSAYRMRSKVANVFDDLGHLESEMSRYYYAQMNYVSSAGEWKALGRDDLAGKQMINAGIALAADNKMTSAFSTMSGGLELCRAYADARKSYTTLAQLLLQVAPFYAAESNTDAEKALLEEAEKAARDSGDALLLATVLKDQADMYQALGVSPMMRNRLTERDKVLSSIIQKGSDASEKLSDPMLTQSERVNLISVAERATIACSQLGKYQQGVDILCKVIASCRASKPNVTLIRALRNLAACYDALDKRSEGLSTRVEAAVTAKSIDEYSLSVDILRDIEQNALDAKDSGTALEALREAKDTTDNRLALADILESRGLLLDRIGQPNEAISELKKASDIYRAELGEPWTPARTLAKLADLQTQSGKPQDAISSLKTAIERIEQWADDEGVDPDAEPGHADTLYNLYLPLIGLQVQDGKTDDAIDRLIKAKQYDWSDRLRSLLSSSGDARIQQVLKASEGQLNAAQSVTRRGEVRKVAGSWTAVLNSVPQFSRVAREVRNTGPTCPIDAGAIFRSRDKLPLGLAIVEYVFADSSVYALIATRQSVSCWELPVSRDKIQSAIKSLKDALKESEGKLAAGVGIGPVKSWSDPSLLPIISPLTEIGEMLFEPLRKDLSQAKTLAFAVPEELVGVPFHAIPKDRKGSFQFLVQDYAVTYIAPGMFNELVETHHGSLNPKTCRVGVFYDSSGNLPGASREKSAIKLAYPNCSTYTGLFATAERFVGAASSCNVIHIAAHHQADPNPAKFSINLAGKSQSGGTVQFSDMLRISNPNLQLAVLSACDTLSSTDSSVFDAAYTAEMFALAGFPSVVGGLWKVSDDASVTLVGSLYKSLGSVGKAEALRRAQISMIQSNERRFANPFYWASFALYGDPR